MEKKPTTTPTPREALDAAEQIENEFYAVKVQRKRKFRGLVASAGCLGLLAAWLVFTGAPIVALAWRFWFGQ